MRLIGILKHTQRVLITLFVILALNACETNSKQGVKEINKEIKQRAEDIVLGSEEATNSIFLYASYNCQYCRYMFSRTFPKLKESYIDKGKLKVILKLVDFGEDPQVLSSLNAASCIAQFGQYQKLHELLVANPNIVRSEDFNLLIDDIMAKNHEIAECIVRKEKYDFVKFNVNEFRSLDFKGTPTMVINNKVFSGFISFENLDKILKQEFKTIRQ